MHYVYFHITIQSIIIITIAGIAIKRDNGNIDNRLCVRRTYIGTI